ncbi:MAG: DUF58 domain-containing protein [Deltaproteobacteria bacterium]|nr:DUF58 domain-containing protein [Deltaproteobacteria bacterium]
MQNDLKNYFDPLILARLSNLYLKSRWVVEGIMSGIHRSRSKGFSVEFEEHREYSPGDEIRRIDWKALGKFDRYFIKETEDETNLRAYIILDVSASMDYASNGISKFSYGCILAASLAHLIIKQQDAAGLVTFSDRIESFIPPRAKRGYLMELLRSLEGVKPAGETSVGRILQEVASKMNRRGLVILISDLLDDADSILEGLHLFRFKGNDVIVFHVLDNAELELPFEGNILFEDMEQVDLRVTADPKAIHRVYTQVVNEFIEKIRTDCRGRSIDYQLLSTSTPLDHALVSYLSWRG